MSVTPVDVTVNANTDYTISFIADNAIVDGDLLGFETFAGGPDFSTQTGLMVNSGNIDLNILAASSSQMAINVNNSNVNSGDTVSFVLFDLTNPPDHGTGGSYQLSQGRPPSFNPIATGVAPGTAYFNPDVIFANDFEPTGGVMNKVLDRRPIQLLNERYELLVPGNPGSD